MGSYKQQHPFLALHDVVIANKLKDEHIFLGKCETAYTNGA
jgi:hypothetical protein